MILFGFLYSICFILTISKLDKRITIIDNKITEFLFFMLVFIFAAIRSDIATDYGSYKQLFLSASGSEYNRLEIGYKFLIRVIRYLTQNNFNVFVFFIAFNSIWLKYWVIKNYRNTILGMLVYFCLFYIHIEYNVMRQGFALSFLLIAVEYGIKQNKKAYYSFVILAGLIHISSLIFLFLYPVCRMQIKFSKKKLVFIFFCFVLIRFFILDIIFSFLLKILGLLPNSAMITQISWYLLPKSDFSITSGLIRRIIVIFVYILLVDENDYNCYFILSFFGAIVYMLLMGADVFAFRMALCFDIFNIPLYAQSKFIINNKKIYIFIFFVIFLGLMFFSPLKGYVIPYKSYLF